MGRWACSGLLFAAALAVLGVSGGVAAARETPPARASFGLAVGALVPRARLDLGPLVALSGAYRLSTARPIEIGVAFDWARLGHTSSPLVGPPAYPRARADLIQTTDVYTTSLGARAALARWSWAAIWAGASLGVTLNRSRFDAYSMEKRHAALAPQVAVAIAVRSRRSGPGWSVELGWREVTHDLGAVGMGGEDVSSGLSLTVGGTFDR